MAGLNNLDRFHLVMHTIDRLPQTGDIEGALFVICVAENWRLGKGKENNLLAGYGADVMVQGHHLDGGDLLNHRFHGRPDRFDTNSAAVEILMDASRHLAMTSFPGSL